MKTDFSIFIFFRKLTHKFTEIFLKLVYVPLLIIFVMYKSNIDVGFINAFIALTMTILLGNMTNKFYKSAIDGVICLNASLLLYLTFEYEFKNYWLMHLILLFLVNHFALPYVSRKFTVPQIDLLIVSLVFLNIFVVNAFF